VKTAKHKQIEYLVQQGILRNIFMGWTVTMTSRNFPGGTEENHDKPQPVFGPRFEPGTSQIRSRNHSTTAFNMWMINLCWSLHSMHRSRVSSVSIVSGCGLDDLEIGVRSPAGAKDFSSNLCVQTGSGAHPASCTMGTGGPFPGDKARPGRDADHSPPSSAEAVNE
jgi:hypothetical protein